MKSPARATPIAKWNELRDEEFLRAVGISGSSLAPGPSANVSVPAYGAIVKRYCALAGEQGELLKIELRLIAERNFWYRAWKWTFALLELAILERVVVWISGVI